jgi:TIR domain
MGMKKVIIQAMHDVFISYARKERERVEPIKNLLEKSGLKVFFDAQDIDAGNEFPEIIDRALKQAAVVLGIWSPYALTRPWVKRECRVGQARGVLVPVALEPLDEIKDIPTEFSGLQYLQLSDDDVSESSRVWREVRNAIEKRLPVQQEASPEFIPIRVQLLRRPKIYISDCGVPESVLTDIGSRLVHVGFDVGETKYSGYYIDVASQYYDQFDVAIIGFGSKASEKWGHAMEEREYLPISVKVYFDPVDMSKSGYGAPLSGDVLHLEDWKRRPERCFSELLPILKRVLIENGWTIFRPDLPHLEIVSLDYWEMAVNNWKRPLIRAGFTLRDQTSDNLRLLTRSEIGCARFSLFVWGTRGTQKDIETLMYRARRGSAIVALVDHNVTLPDSVKEECNIFNLCPEELNKSVVGTDEWERMLEVLGAAVRASDEMTLELDSE